MTPTPEPEALGLRWSGDDEPGLRRRRAGRGFVLLDDRGRRVTDERVLARVRALAIPPAYTDVWICADANGHLQATGRDAKGRKQYRYHPAWRAAQDERKFDRLVPFGEALPTIRRHVAHDLARPGVPREKVLAAVVHLLQTTLIRVGNEEYARANESYGLTTLRSPHAEVSRGDVHFLFRGKSGKEHEIVLHDPRVAVVVRRCQDLPGQHLFQYREAGQVRRVGSADVNAYLREVSGGDFTAKDFRTWMGTVLVATALATLEVPASDAAGRRATVAALDAVARRLGNTRTVARTSYVHPAVIDGFLSGELAARWARGPGSDGRWLVREERRLLSYLRWSERSARARARTRARAAA